MISKILLVALAFSIAKIFIVGKILAVRNEEEITIHVVPHTHDDAGWLWTFDDYFEGTGGANVRVHSILDNFVLSLENNPDRTFIYVEMAFFTKWYKLQDDSKKLLVKKLLKEGRFEFINGGYVMHDEAASYYQHFIDQMRLGLQFLKEEFDYKPEIAWFIDPFGHSASNAYVLAKMGFTKIAFVRIDYKEKEIRRANKTLEFYWTPFNQVDSATKIFTHVTYDHYCPPQGMSGFIDDKEIDFSQDQLVEKSNKIYEDLQNWNSGYKHKNVLLMYGCDFAFNAKDANFKNVEKAMDYINKNKPGMKMIYSTPSKYFNTIFEQVQDWPEYKNQDFFPYADNAWSYWTGYLTSRPFLKGLVRDTGNYLTTSSKFIMENLLRNALKGANISSSKLTTAVEKQFFLRENLAICQHHDAVAGTAKEHVSEDYELRLNSSIEVVKDTMLDSLKEMVPELDQEELKVCINSPVSNIKCQNIYATKMNGKFLLAIQNPGLDGAYPISIDFKNVTAAEVRDETDNLLTSDLFCNPDKTYEDFFNCKLRFFYNFNISKSLTTISLTLSNKETKSNKVRATKISNDLIKVISANDLEVLFDAKNLSFLSTEKGGKQYKHEIKHAYYNSYNGKNSDLRPDASNPDGAYILSTVEVNPIDFKLDQSRTHILTGKLSTQIFLRFENSYLILNVVKNPHMIEAESIWDPITDRSHGKNFLLLITSDILNNVLLPDGQTQPEFWTDSNGMKMMRRIKDFRQGWKYTVTDKVSGNFYPVNSIISIRDRINYNYSENDYDGISSNDRVITVHNDRPQSGGVMSQGQIMLLLHRFSEKDDARGVGEPLYENSSADTYFHTKHFISFSNSIEPSYFENLIQNKPSLFSFGDFNKKVSLESLLHQLVETSKNIVLNFHIKSANRVYVQAFNMQDYYFTDPSDYSSEESVSFKKISGINYSVIEYNFSSIEPLSSNFRMEAFLKYMTDLFSETSYSIKPQDFKLFLLEFKN